MTRAFAAGLACLLLIALPAQAATAPATLPFVQGWADTGQISVDDDWSRRGRHRRDTAATVWSASPGSDPRGVTADGSGTPVDVAANLTDPRAVGLAAGVAEFELPRPGGGDPGLRHGERTSSGRWRSTRAGAPG